MKKENQDMTKNELITALAERSGQDRKAAAATLDALVGILTEVGSTQGKLTLTGFGTFKGKTRPAGTARNPATGGTVEVPEKKVLTFKASSALQL
jgi:nucleoid DNA-binding protein